MKSQNSVRTAAIFLSAIALGGCQLPRFGNQVVNAPQPNVLSGIMNDSLSGYYQTAIQDQLLCSDNSPTGGEVCRSVPATTTPTHAIPQLPFQFMTNPMALVMTDMSDPEAMSGYLVGLGYTSNPPNMGVLIDSTGSIFYVAGQTSTAFFDTACTVQWLIEVRGKLDAAAQGYMAGNYPVSGRVEADFNVSQIYDGSCAPTMQAMQACYLNHNNCGGANDSDNVTRYNTVVAAFGDFIQAGTMSASDIPNVTRTAYHFSFQ